MNFRYLVTEQEANTILQALAKQPFSEVFQLINSIQTQSREQLDDENKRHVVVDPEMDNEQ
jgi:hypothetical protein